MRGARAGVVPCALAIAGFDPSGGAGIAADLRGFAAAGAWGAAAVAVWTVQSTAGLARATPLAARDVERQAREVLANQRVRALKSGALGSAENARLVARLARETALPLVVDPVALATRARGGARLLDRDATKALDALVRVATVVTPNAREAEQLTGIAVVDVASAGRAARALVAGGARAALVKGGHLEGPRAIDVLATTTGVVRVSAQRRPGLDVHGTGCTLASLVAGRLARAEQVDDDAIVAAVRFAKRALAAALARSLDVGAGQRVFAP